MEMEIVVPDEVPVMTLPQVVFFPQALLPLHIFEPRYRTMLVDVLAKDRLMAVVGLDPRRANEPEAFEPPHRVATVGIIRACQKTTTAPPTSCSKGFAAPKSRTSPASTLIGPSPSARCTVKLATTPRKPNSSATNSAG